jgi:hypothetical protein
MGISPNPADEKSEYLDFTQFFTAPATPAPISTSFGSDITITVTRHGSENDPGACEVEDDEVFLLDSGFPVGGNFSKSQAYPGTDGTAVYTFFNVPDAAVNDNTMGFRFSSRCRSGDPSDVGVASVASVQVTAIAASAFIDYPFATVPDSDALPPVRARRGTMLPY